MALIPHSGRFEVICGPMFSGKSEELIRRLRRAKIAKQSVVTFKHVIDTRDEIEYIVSHDGNMLNAQSIERVEDIIKLVEQHNVQVIGIDEVQFFPQEVISVITQLINMNRRIIVAGLDLDFRGVPFGCMPTLLAIADDITKLKAICSICNNDAHFTQRLVNSQPASYHDPIILIGAQESYQARCRECFSIDRKPTWQELRLPEKTI